MRIHRRPIDDADIEFLCRVYASTRTEELATVPWSTQQKDAFLRQQFTLQHAYYKKQYADARFDVLLLDGLPIGRLYVARWPGEIRIIDITLLPEHRNAGHGARLIRELFDEADASGKKVSIHVEMNNPARSLYERLGFARQGEHGIYLLMERPAQLHATP